MNELNAVGPENQGEARRYGAQSPLVHTMASDLFPMVSWDFGSMDPEKLALQGARMRAGTFLTSTAVAARFAGVGLANPAGSGVIAVVEVITIQPNAAMGIRLVRQGAAVSALQGSVQGSALDSRITELASVRQLATDEAAIGNYGTAVRFINRLTAESFEVNNCPFVLAPNSTLWVVGNTANTTLLASFQWRQRKIEDGEVTPV